MKLSKFFKYGFLTICLLGDTIAMEKKYEGNEFGEININIHPDLFYENHLRFGCISESLCVFLPFQENTATEKATKWEETTGWSIDGYTGDIKKLEPFKDNMSWRGYYLPQGMVGGKLDESPYLLTLSNGTIQKKPLSPEIKETLINPESSALDVFFEKVIDLSDKNYSPDGTFRLDNLQGDQDSVLFEMFSCYRPNLYFIINDISSSHPTIKPVSFLGVGYKLVDYYLKNNHIFSISSLVDEEESTVSHEDGDMFDVDVDEKSGVFAVHDLNGQLLYKEFFPSMPHEAYFVGNRIFVISYTKMRKIWTGEYRSENTGNVYKACSINDYRHSTQVLSAFNIKEYL